MKRLLKSLSLAIVLAALGIVVYLWRTGELSVFYYDFIGVHFYKAQLYNKVKGNNPEERANALSRLVKDFGDLKTALRAIEEDPSPLVRSRLSSDLSGWPIIAADFEDMKRILTALARAMTEDEDREVRYSASFGIKQSAIILKEKLPPKSYKEIALLYIPYLEKAVEINDRNSGKEYAQEALWIFKGE